MRTSIRLGLVTCLLSCSGAVAQVAPAERFTDKDFERFSKASRKQMEAVFYSLTGTEKDALLEGYQEWKSRQGLKPLEPAELFKLVAPYIVTVQWENALGSGVLVGRRIVTNAHVVIGSRFAKRGARTETTQQPSPTISGLPDSGTTWSTAAFVDRGTDIAVLVLSFDARLPESQLALRRASTIAVGERVYAIGSPLGLERTLSEGLVSGVRRLPGGLVRIQTTAPISHGSSGGGLFDQFGRLIGITTASVVEGQNVNLAVAVEDVERGLAAAEDVDHQSAQERAISDLVSAQTEQIKACVAVFGRGTPLPGMSIVSPVLIFSVRLLRDGRLADIHPPFEPPEQDARLIRCLTGVLHGLRGKPHPMSWVFTVPVWLPLEGDSAASSGLP